MKYRSGVKYTVEGDWSVYTALKGYAFETKHLKMSPDGIFTLKDGYPSDGPSGPTMDSRYCMRGAFFHDGGYEAIRQGLLPMSCREYFDGLLYLLIVDDGYKMIERWGHLKPIQWAEKKIVERRALGWYNAVIEFAESAALAKSEPKIYDTEAA
ncbi:MAG: hypothetical protein CVU71_03585 [Deltaproteobacteria bacterium HGW-Deltaproteobacteria-6]|jgi:hypothetical protein|nr:MAG: hypothetical protein CVU71_03585 [Deltaproteobacteria bacterium HGW-Deltaproteobacteria-6]